MSLLDPRQKTISLKVVYYGPGLGGKTTSLKQIHRVIDPEGRVKLVSLDTDEDRTLFFDFLPIELGLVGRFKIKIQGFTVPGQVKYNMTRRYVLTGADGIVFVADSDPSRVVENVESLINLGDNLRAHGLNVNNIPLVFQYNKQDLSTAVSPGELEEKLNFRKVPGFATVATRGDGVFDAFVAVSKLMVSRVIKTYNLKQEQADEERILREVENRLRSLGTEEAMMPAVASFNPGQSAAAPAPTPAPTAVSGPPMTPAASSAAPATPATPATPDATAREADDFFGSFTGGAPAEKASPAPRPQATDPIPLPAPPLAVEPAPVSRPVAPPPAAAPPPPEVAISAPEPAPGLAACALPTETPPHSPQSSAPEAVSAAVQPSPEPAPVAVAEPCPAPCHDVAEEGETPPAAETRRPPHAAPQDSTGLRNLLRSLREVGRSLAAGAPFEQSAAVILAAACHNLEAVGGSVLALNHESGQFEARLTNGYRGDPLLLAGPSATERFLELLQSGVDQLLVSEERNQDLFQRLSAVSPGMESAVMVPLIIGNEVEGALCVYLDEPLDPFARKDALKALMVLAYQAAVGLRMAGSH